LKAGGDFDAIVMHEQILIASAKVAFDSRLPDAVKSLRGAGAVKNVARQGGDGVVGFRLDLDVAGLGQLYLRVKIEGSGKPCHRERARSPLPFYLAA
jgi:hypothetical protein